MKDETISLPEPAAWLVTDGRTYRDKAFTSEINAIGSIAERKDGARIEPLFTADQVRAAALEERERCAKLCESMSRDWIARGQTVNWEFRAHGAEECASAIRCGDPA